MAVNYSGDQGGVQKSLYVIGINGDFKGVLPTTGSTTDYSNAGGVVYAAGASLDPFKSSRIFTNFLRSKVISVKNLSKFDTQFAQKATKGPFTGVSITGDNSSRASIPDPRATHRILLQKKTTTPFVSSFTGISHMDEIIFTRRGSGLTLQAFFMGFANGVTIGNTLDILVGYLGNTGSGGITSFKGMTGGLGLSLEAKNVKSGGTSGVNTISEILTLNDVGHKVIEEASSTVFGGETLGVTFGKDSSSLRTAVIERDDLYNSGKVRTILQDLVFRSDTLAKNHACFTNDSRFIKQIFVRSIYDGEKLPISSSYNGGITIDGVSGGTNGTSELDHLIAQYDDTIRQDQTNIFETLKTVNAARTIRTIMNVSF